MWRQRDADSDWSLLLLEDTTLLSKPAGDLPMGSKRGQEVVQEMQKPFLHLANGPPCPAQKSHEATGRLEVRPAHTLGGGQGLRGSGRLLVEPCIRAQTEQKRRSLGLGGRLGAMETHRAKPSLVTGAPAAETSAALSSAQALSYREAISRAVNQLSERSSS